MEVLAEYEVFDILTGKITGVINRSLLSAFANGGINITTEQWTVLECLWNQDNVTQQTLCDLTRKDRPSMTRLIDNLEKLDLVKRMAHARDRRKNMIQLTPNGASIMIKTRQIVSNVVDKALHNIDPDQIPIARSLLKKIMRNLEG